MADLSGPVGDTQPSDLAEKVAAISQWIDDSYPAGLDPELVMRRRVGKVGNEHGETLQAIEAWTGENPRKGVYGTDREVIKELLDTAVASLGAVEHLTGNKGLAMPMLDGHIEFVYERAGLNHA